MIFPTKAIRDVTEVLIDYRGKTPTKTNNGVKLITAKVIKDGFIVEGDHEYVAEADYDGWMRRGLPKQWDILITTEAPLGEVAQLRSPERIALAQRVILLRGNPSVIDQGFYFQALKSPFVQAGVRARSSGTTVLGIKQSELWHVKIPCPGLPIQRRIAGILSAYDDLIENNTRRIKVLEEMAQMLYREWFVNFRFPGHEKVRMVESELGPIPEGWPVVGFDEISDILSGGTPKTTEPAYWNGPIPFFGPTDAPDSYYVIGTTKSITEQGLSKCNSKLYPAETVFITARGTVGKVALPACSMAMNQSCYALRGKPGINQLALFLITKDCARQLKQKSHGAVFDTITVETFQKLRLARPTDTLLSRLESATRPMFGLLLNLLRSNATLRNTRDLLLPKLISGEIPVEAAAEPMGQPA